jgi:hypothetical protein
MSDSAILETARAMLALDIPAECLAGVGANLALLAEHARRVGDLDD